MIIIMVFLVFVMIRFSCCLGFECRWFILVIFGFRIYLLLMKLMCVVLIGFMNGMFEIVSVVDVVIMVMILGLFIRLCDSMVYMIRILFLKFVVNSGW